MAGTARARAAAAKKFGLDWEEFQDRHELASPAFETGRITLDTYLQRTVFYRKRSFHAGRIHGISFLRSRKNFRNRARFCPTWPQPENICLPPSTMKRSS